MSDVFISYSRRDKDFANQLVNALEREKRDVWIDWQDIPTGTQFLDEIFEGIANADVFIFIASSNSLISEFCNYEIERARESSKRIIPVIRQRLEGQDNERVREVWSQNEWGTIAEENWSIISQIDWIFADNDEQFDEMYRTLIHTVDTDIEHVKAHTRYHVRALDWQSARENPSFLLYGDEIVSAEAWLAESYTNEKDPMPNELQRRYILEARRVEDARVARIADMEAHSKRLQKQTSRFQIIAAVAVIIVLIAIGVVISAIRRSTSALAESNAKQTEVASAEIRLTEVGEEVLNQQTNVNALRVAARAEDVYPQNNVLGLSLALAANQLSENPPTQAQRILSDLAYRQGAVRILTGHTDRVRDLAFSPMNSDVVFSASNDGSVLAWDIQTGDIIRKYRQHVDWVTSLAVHPDGAMMLSGACERRTAIICLSGEIILWDIASGDSIYRQPAHSASVRDITFSPDGTQFVTASDDLTLILWDTETGNQIRQFEGHTVGVTSVSFSPDGESIISSSDDNTVLLWDVSSGRSAKIIEHDDDVNAVVYSPDGEFIATASEDHTVRMSDARTGNLLWESDLHDKPVLALAFDPLGQFIATGGDDHRVILWDALTGIAVNQFTEHTESVISLAFDPAGNYLISGSIDTTITLWDLNNGDEVRLYDDHDKPILGVAISPDGTRVLSSTITPSDAPRLWDLATGDLIRDYFGVIDARINQFFFLPDNSQFIALEAETDIRLHDVETGETIRTYTENQPLKSNIDVSHDGQMVGAAYENGGVTIWDIETGEIKYTIRTPAAIAKVAFSPDSQSILLATETSGALLLFDIETQSLQETFNTDEDFPNALAFSPDGRYVVRSSHVGVNTIWDIETGELVRRLQFADQWIYGAAFSPDSKTVVTNSEQSAIIWDIETGEILREFKGFRRMIAPIRYTPDGNHVLVADEATLVLLREDTPEQLIDWTVNNRVVRELTCDERFTYNVTPYCDDQVAPPKPTLRATPTSFLLDGIVLTAPPRSGSIEVTTPPELGE